MLAQVHSGCSKSRSICGALVLIALVACGQPPSASDETATQGGQGGQEATGSGGNQGGQGGTNTKLDASAAPDPNAEVDAAAPTKAEDASTTNPDASFTIPDGFRRAIVAVGYGGVRARSLDDGATWEITGQDQAHGGDDGNLLRSVAYGNGMWVAGGWNKWHTSPDGKVWTTRTHNFGIMQGMAFGNGYFLASEMNGNIVKSTDGITWKMVGHAGTGKHTELAFGNAKFAAWGNDNSAVETSTDGSTWKPSTLKSAVFCGGADFQPESACFGSGQPGAWDTNLWVKSVFPGQILKSIDGKKWSLGFRYDANGFDALGIGMAPK